MLAPNFARAASTPEADPDFFTKCARSEAADFFDLVDRDIHREKTFAPAWWTAMAAKAPIDKMREAYVLREEQFRNVATAVLRATLKDAAVTTQKVVGTETLCTLIERGDRLAVVVFRRDPEFLCYMTGEVHELIVRLTAVDDKFAKAEKEGRVVAIVATSAPPEDVSLRAAKRHGVDCWWPEARGNPAAELPPELVC